MAILNTVNGIVSKISNPTKTKGVRKNKSEELEIELELESGLVVDFIPDFRVQQNTADHNAVQWRLSNGKHPGDMGILCREFQNEESIYTIIFSGPDV